VAAGAVLGGLLGLVIGGGVVFRGVLFGEASFLGEHGLRVLGLAARLFALPAAVGGAAAALVAFGDRGARAWGRRPSATAPGLTGLLVAAVAAPAGLGLYAAGVLGPDAAAAGNIRVGALANAALLCGVAGLLAGVLLGRAALRYGRPRPLR
jgi:hypothetical protein